MTDARPRLLDTFCGAGGAGVGYDHAGFDVFGVDIEPQCDYPFAFLQADALDTLTRLLAGELVPDGAGGSLHLDDFAAFHASPPCPVHSSMNGWSGVSTSPDLIPQTRKALQSTGALYVIENVEGAPLVNPVRICGQAMGLRVRRHRLFESNFPIMVPPCYHPEPPVIVVGGSIGRKVFDPCRKAIAPTFEQAKEVMGMPWVTTRKGVVNAIPPLYAEHIGGYMMTALGHG